MVMGRGFCCQIFKRCTPHVLNLPPSLAGRCLQNAGQGRASKEGPTLLEVEPTLTGYKSWVELFWFKDKEITFDLLPVKKQKE